MSKKSHDPIRIVSYFIYWAKTSWTYSNKYKKRSISEFRQKPKPGPTCCSDPDLSFFNFQIRNPGPNPV